MKKERTVESIAYEQMMGGVFKLLMEARAHLQQGARANESSQGVGSRVPHRLEVACDAWVCEKDTL